MVHGWWVARVASIAGVGLLSLGLAGAASAQESCTDAGGGSRDIRALSATYDLGTQDIVVTMRLCAPADGQSKYRVRFDTVLNQVEYPSGSGVFVPASILDGNVACLASDDAGAMWFKGKATGPGTAVVSGDTVTFRAALDAFSPAVPIGATVRVWADVQYRGIVDQAPNVVATDGCTRPQRTTEVVSVFAGDPDAVVGTQAFDVRRDLLRRSESAMGNLVADALLAADPTADVALTNSGGLRQDLLVASTPGGEQPGEITWRELFAVLPFGNVRVAVTVTGAQLAADLDNGVSSVCNPALGTGRFPQVAGLRFVYTCVGLDATLLSLERIGAGGVGVPIAPGDLVRVVTNDFMQGGGDGYAGLAGGTNVTSSYEMMLDTVIGHVSASSPIAPIVEGRITQVVP
jgi:hypothetical protein